MTSTGSNRQTPLQERLKNIFFQEKERKGKRRVHAADRPTFQRAATGLLPARQQGSFQVFFTCTSCPPTHTTGLSVHVCSHAPAAFSSSPTSTWIESITHNVAAGTLCDCVCVCVSVRVCVIWMRVPG